MDGPNVDIVGDAHSLSEIITISVDFIFSISTFEHFLMPWKAVLEINRVLSPGGLVFSHSHQAWLIHDEPWDFFRFSKWSWASLFNAHTGFKVLDARHGEPVAIDSVHNPAGAFEGLELSLGYGLSVSLCEEVGDAKEVWASNVGELTTIEYLY